MKKFESLHIYAQCCEHDEAYIVGSIDALVALRDALDRAIRGNRAAASTAFANDGEGYYTLAIPVDPATFDRLAQPYAAPRSDRPSDIGPWDLNVDWSACRVPQTGSDATQAEPK